MEFGPPLLKAVGADSSIYNRPPLLEIEWGAILVFTIVPHFWQVGDESKTEFFPVYEFLVGCDSKRFPGKGESSPIPLGGGW